MSGAYQKNLEVAQKAEATQLQYELKWLIQAGDAKLSEVKNKVAEGADINAQDENGRMSLHFAVLSGATNIIEFLSQQPGIRWDIPDKNGLSAAGYLLKIAILNNDQMQAKRALDLGANVNQQDEFGMMSLHWATMYPARGEMVEFLLKQKDIQSDIPDNNGWTPLAGAVYDGKDPIVIKQFLKQGAKLEREKHSPIKLLEESVGPKKTQKKIRRLLQKTIKPKVNLPRPPTPAPLATLKNESKKEHEQGCCKEVLPKAGWQLKNNLATALASYLKARENTFLYWLSSLKVIGWLVRFFSKRYAKVQRARQYQQVLLSKEGRVLIEALESHQVNIVGFLYKKDIGINHTPIPGLLYGFQCHQGLLEKELQKSKILPGVLPKCPRIKQA